jgi:hypothetical protein
VLGISDNVPKHLTYANEIHRPLGQH